MPPILEYYYVDSVLFKQVALEKWYKYSRNKIVRYFLRKQLRMHPISSALSASHQLPFPMKLPRAALGAYCMSLVLFFLVKIKHEEHAGCIVMAKD